MRKIPVTALVVNKTDAKNELERIIKQMIVTRFFKRTYMIENVQLLYVPFAVLEYNIHGTGKTKKAKRMSHIFLSMELGSGVIKPFTDLIGFDVQEKMIQDRNVAYQRPNMEKIIAAAKKELLFKILPKNLKYWKDYDMDLIEDRIIYRPLWIMRYRIFGQKMRIYKKYGDCFNL